MHCPTCKLAHNPPPDAVIETGDYTVCPDCATILTIDGDRLRLLTIEEWNGVYKIPELIARIRDSQHRVILGMDHSGKFPPSPAR